MVLRTELPAVIKCEDDVPVREYSVVGSEFIDQDTLHKVKRALEIAPPQQFDLARQTQVYAALIQFVDLTFEGFNIQSRRIQLPKTLPLIASQDRALKDRVTASLKVLDKIEKPKALQDVTKLLEELRQAYLVPVGQAGRVMLKSKRQSFENELTEIETRLTECKETLKQDLQEALNKVIDAIVPDLSRAVLADPPPRFRGLFSATEDSAAAYVREELAKSFPTAEELISEMKIHKFYKDVTYETLKNKEFGERVMKEIPKSVLEGSLLQEDVAAKAGTAMS
jgi:predicted GNAT family acetyltransferase